MGNCFRTDVTFDGSVSSGIPQEKKHKGTHITQRAEKGKGCESAK